MLLALADPFPAHAKHFIVTALQADDKGVGIRQLGRLLHFGITRGQSAEADIFPDRPLEQE
ncbi:hypothetical protein D3C76_1620500 [compost metagenome]